MQGIYTFAGFAILLIGGGGGLYMARDNAFFGGLITLGSVVAFSWLTGIGKGLLLDLINWGQGMFGGAGF